MVKKGGRVVGCRPVFEIRIVGIIKGIRVGFRVI
jgi:hypothetical protein